MLESITKPKDRPIMATICGDSGLGKTSLASSFPKPIVIRAEDGLQAIPTDKRPDAFPVLSEIAPTDKAVNTLWAQLTALLHEDHDYKTLIIDSVTALERLFVQYVIDQDPKAKNINQAAGGYGAGYSTVGSMHGRVRKAAGLLNTQKHMNIIFVAHVDVETMKLPDADDYMRYSLRLHEKSMPAYVDDVDLVGFLRLVQFVRGSEGERKMAVSTGERELICYPTASNVSKNRYGITEPLTVAIGQNPLKGLVPIAGATRPKPKPEPQPEPQDAVTETETPTEATQPEKE